MNKDRYIPQSDMVADALGEALREAEKGKRPRGVTLDAIPQAKPRLDERTPDELVEGWAKYEDRRSSRSHEGRALVAGKSSNAPPPVPASLSQGKLTDKEWAAVNTGAKLVAWNYDDADFGAYLHVERALCRMKWSGQLLRAFRAWLFFKETGRTIQRCMLWDQRLDIMQNRPETYRYLLYRELRKPTAPPNDSPQARGAATRYEGVSEAEKAAQMAALSRRRWGQSPSDAA